MGLITTVFILALWGDLVSCEGNLFMGGLYMRFSSKLTMAAAAIFFALSVSVHANGHDTTSNSIGSKVYQVCKKWRVDQGGWMATDQMQHCRTVLFCASAHTAFATKNLTQCMSKNTVGYSGDSGNVSGTARNVAKACLQDGNC